MTNLTNLTKKELFLKSYKSKMGHISKACEAINVVRQTYYDWIKVDPKFKQSIENIDEGFIDLAECGLRKNIKKRMQRAIEFYLCNKKKSNYSNTVKNELTGPGGSPIRYIIEKTYEQPENKKIEEKDEKKVEKGEPEEPKSG